jgi:hypothetical protein
MVEMSKTIVGRVGKSVLPICLIIAGLGSACVRPGMKLAVSQSPGSAVFEGGITWRGSGMIGPIEPPPAVTDSKGAARAIRQLTRPVTPLYFESNRADLEASEQSKLRQLALWLQEDIHRASALRVEGDCDTLGAGASNLELGGRRARKVKEFLAGLGVDLNRVEVVSYGSAKACEGRVPVPIPSSIYERRHDFTDLGR